jgi:hypothetical protein
MGVKARDYPVKATHWPAKKKVRMLFGNALTSQEQSIGACGHAIITKMSRIVHAQISFGF